MHALMFLYKFSKTSKVVYESHSFNNNLIYLYSTKYG